MIVARVIRTFRDQGGGSILQICSLTLAAPWQEPSNAIEGRGDHRHAELTGSMSLQYG